MQNVAIVVLGVDINAFQFAHRLRKDEGILPIDSATDLKKKMKVKSSRLVRVPPLLKLKGAEMIKCECIPKVLKCLYQCFAQLRF